MTTKPPPMMIPPVPMTPINQVGEGSANAASASANVAPAAPVQPMAPGMVDPLALPPPVVDNLPPPTKRSNPGPMERCDQDIQRVLRVDTFDGARFELQKMLGPHFATAHTIYMGSSAHEKGYCKF